MSREKPRNPRARGQGELWPVPGSLLWAMCTGTWRHGHTVFSLTGTAGTVWSHKHGTNCGPQTFTVDLDACPALPTHA